MKKEAGRARKLSSECQRAKHDMVCNNRAWRGKMVGDRAWKGGTIVVAGQKGPAAARQSLLAKLPFFTEAKSARMAVMAHALKPVAARDKNIEY